MYRRFRGTQCLHHQRRRMFVIFQKTSVFLVTVMRTPDLATLFTPRENGSILSSVTSLSECC